MILFAVLAGMALIVVLCLLMPLLRPPPPPPRPRAEHDAEIYRDQLAEVERERARGLVTGDQFEASRAEIGRRLLAAADAREEAATRGEPLRGRAILAAVLACVLPLAAGGLYLWQGAPFIGGGAASAGRDAAQPADGDAELAALVGQLARRMEEQPDNVRGWRLLARSLSSLQRHSEAAAAYARASALLPADADLRARRGEALAAAAAGTVTPEAERAFAAALAIDPGEPRAHFYLGLAALQKGDRGGALARWRALERESPEDAEWLPMLRRRIEALRERE